MASLFSLSVLSLGLWLFAGDLLAYLGSDWLLSLPIAVWLVISTRALTATRMSHKACIYAGLPILAVLSLLPRVIFRIWPNLLLGNTYFLIPLAGVLLVILLLFPYVGLTYQTRRSGSPTPSRLITPERTTIPTTRTPRWSAEPGY